MSFTQTFGGGTLNPAQPSYAAYTSTTSLSLSWPLETAPSNNIVAAINNISLTAGLTVTLAAASQISVGQSALFNNVGSQTFSVLGASGAVILTATAGAAWYAYITDTSTTSGTWSTFQQGAGTSAASASALAGYGLVAITTTLNQQYSAASTAVTPLTIDATYRAALETWTGGAGVWNLTAAATLTNGWFFNVYNNGTGALALTPAGADTINGSATAFTLNPGNSCILICDGTSAFYTVGFGQSVSFAFDYNSIDVSGTGNYTLSGTQLNRIAYRFTGILTGNRDIIVPATVQQYWVDNSTTGAFTLGVRTAAQASPGVTVSNGSTRMITYSNGTTVVNADTQGLTSPVTVSQGGTGATTASSARANLDVPSTLDMFTAALLWG